MRKRSKHYYRAPHMTTGERRASYDEDAQGLIRGKRQRKHLASTWDDIHCSQEWNWKNTRKEQYHGFKRKKFVIEIDCSHYNYGRFFNVEQIIKDHGFRFVEVEVKYSGVCKLIYWGKRIDFQKDYVKYLAG